jgi:predicted alpha/beta superfamily hydrolase
MSRSTRFRLVAGVVSVLVLLALFAREPRAAARGQGTETAGDGGAEARSAVTIGQWHALESEVLGETRRFIVSTPEGYEGGDERYSVLYLLDGDMHFLHTTGLIDFLVRNDLMPPTLVVAVTNTERTRDMTPPAREADPMMGAGGGAADFLRFFRDELVPWVDARYRTHDYRVLVGHSLGGLFAIHALVHEPDLFDGYIAISPSLQWDEQRLVEQADAFFRETESLDKTLYMTTGNEGSALTGGVLKLAGVLTEHAPEGFEWESRIMEEETHNSVVHRSTRQGLELVFRHWGLRDVIGAYDAGGLDALHAHFRRATERYGIERELSTLTVTQLAAGLAFNGRLDESIAVIEHDPDRHPPNGMIYRMIGTRYEDREDRDGAIRCYSRALELNPADERARERLIGFGVDVSALAPRFEVTEEVLRSYVGGYVAAGMPGRTTVALGDGELLLEGPPGKLTLAPISADRFAVADRPVEFLFTRDEAGKVTGISVEFAGQVFQKLERED